MEINRNTIMVIFFVLFILGGIAGLFLQDDSPEETIDNEILESSSPASRRGVEGKQSVSPASEIGMEGKEGIS